jgi:hypothetical protein
MKVNKYLSKNDKYLLTFYFCGDILIMKGDVGCPVQADNVWKIKEETKYETGCISQLDQICDNRSGYMRSYRIFGDHAKIWYISCSPEFDA